MTTSEPAEKIQAAAQTISTAVMVLKMEEPTMRSFLKECRDMESFGSVTHPSLYRDPTRKAVSALMQPLFEAALDFLKVYDAHIEHAKSAVKKVSAA